MQGLFQNFVVPDKLGNFFRLRNGCLELGESLGKGLGGQFAGVAATTKVYQVFFLTGNDGFSK